MNYWLPVIITGVATLIFRLSFLGGLVKFTLPPTLKRGLEYVPAAVMAALVSTGFFLDEQKQIALTWPSLAAFLAAGLLAWKFKRDLLTIGGGLAVFWLVTLI